MSVVSARSRVFAVGDSFAIVGNDLILVVLNLETAGASAVMKWLDMMTPFSLVADSPMPDGRFALLLERI